MVRFSDSLESGNIDIANCEAPNTKLLINHNGLWPKDNIAISKILNK